MTDPTFRPCLVLKRARIDGTWRTVERGIARFHCFGVDYEEFETGPGNYSAAVVEWPDGTVELVPAGLIKFLDRGQQDMPAERGKSDENIS